MGQIETRGPRGAAFLQRLLSNDVRRLPEGGAQYSVICNEDGGVLDDLFTYRLADCALPDGHKRRQPRARPRLVHEPTQELRRRRARPPARHFAMLAVQGPRRGRSSRGLTDGGAAAAYALLRAHAGGSPDAGLRHRLHGRGRGRAAARSRQRAAQVWDALLAAGATPVGLGARDTLRLEVCFPPLRQRPERGARADRGRASAGAARRQTGFIGADASRAVRARRARTSGWWRS